MRRASLRLSLLALPVALIASCGGGNTTPPSSVTRAFGTLTPRGPQVSGVRRGTISVGGRTGAAYDVSGDGMPDEIDIDGDGVSDGEDIDGDGVITVWSDLQTGRAADTHPEQSLPTTDPDFITALDPSNTPRNSAAGGSVNEPATLAPSMGPDRLRAISQGQQGACTAFSVAAVATLVRHRREAAAAPSLDANTLWASPSWIYARALRDGMGMCNGGTTAGNALNNLVLTGAATMTEQPFRSASMPTLCEALTPDPAAAPHLYRIGSHTRVANGLTFRAQVKEALAAGLPVTFGVSLPTGFMDFRATVAGVDVTRPFRGNGTCTDSSHCGGHQMVFVGYDDARSAYRVLNSWGTDWGDNGYLWWDYASLEALGDLDANVVIPIPHAPAPLAPPNLAGLTMTQPAGSQVILTRQPGAMGGAATWRMIVRVEFSEPVRVTSITPTFDSTVFTNEVNVAISYGDLSFSLPGDTMPAMGTMIPVTVSGALRDGTAFSKTLTLAAPAPRATP